MKCFENADLYLWDQFKQTATEFAHEELPLPFQESTHLLMQFNYIRILYVFEVFNLLVHWQCFLYK